MRREIRRVPPNWEHPLYIDTDAPSAALIGLYRPTNDASFEDAATEWKEGLRLWELGTHPSQLDEEFWEFQAPPSKVTSRPVFGEDATWHQLYELARANDVGVPLTPAFPTEGELIDYVLASASFE